MAPPPVTSAAARRARPRASRPAPGTRIRWDYIGRMAMVCVLAALLYFYGSAALSLLSSRHEIAQNDAQLSKLEREHRQLLIKREALLSPGRELEEARELGMQRPGEHVYHVSGLPRD